MSNFTKDKWKYDEHLGIVHTENRSIASVYEAGNTACFTHTPEGQANARLIAAAPDMYRLMKSVVDFDYTAFKFDTNGNLIFTREKYDEFRDLLVRIDGEEANS